MGGDLCHSLPVTFLGSKRLFLGSSATFQSIGILSLAQHRLFLDELRVFQASQLFLVNFSASAVSFHGWQRLFSGLDQMRIFQHRRWLFFSLPTILFASARRQRLLELYFLGGNFFWIYGDYFLGVDFFIFAATFVGSTLTFSGSTLTFLVRSRPLSARRRLFLDSVVTFLECGDFSWISGALYQRGGHFFWISADFFLIGGVLVISFFLHQ